MSSKDNQVHPDLVEVALDRVEGFAFERFANDFMASLEGRAFTPLGGYKDGGADAVEMRELHSTDADGVFYQFTVQANHRDKIRKTVKRLREFGRTPKALRYLTSRLIPHIDKEEDLLSDELDVRIRIQDGKYISSHINVTNGTVGAYQHHLAQYTSFLEKVGRSTQTSTIHINDPTVFVFLQHEVANRLGNRKLVHSITDTLVLWALRDTDPDNDALLSREEILDSITETFPWARAFIKNHLDERLSALRAKSAGGREVRWHRKADKYCLPYETRESIKQENSEDEALRISFIDELSLRASELFSSDDGEYELVSHIALDAIEKIFERQGLMLAHFVTDEEDNEHPLVASDCIQEIVKKKDIPARKQNDYCDYAERLVCSVFYDSTPTQRQYLALLARTYVLLFTLQAEPRIIEYFSSMSGSFNLFVGSDMNRPGF